MLWLVLIVIAVALVLEWRSMSFPAEWVNYRREPSKRSVEPGEEFLLKTTIENATKRNIPYLFVAEPLHETVKIVDKTGLDLTRNKNTVWQRSTYFVRKRQRVRRNLRVAIHERGMYKFEKAELRFGDFLGIKEIVREIKGHQNVVVYPNRLEDSRLQQVLSDIFGEVSVRSFLYEDPMLVMGYRDYTGREPLKSISFPMSAKRNVLTVTEFDHTREEMVDLIFDVSYKGDFDHFAMQLETIFCMARTLCEGFEQKKLSYRLITNAFYASMEVRGVNVIQSGGSGGSSFRKILEILGSSTGAPMCKTGELLQYSFTSFSQEKEFVYISLRREDDTQELIKRMERQYGQHITCLYGEDFENSFLEEKREREEKRAC